LQIGTDVSGTATQILASTFPTVTLQSYAAVYAGWDMIYDSFNDRNVYIPKNIFGAVVMARTDRVANTWDAPAGQNRGILPSIGQGVIFSDTDIGNLYEQNINTSRFIRGVGNVLWGQKTAQKKKSALDRINVRRLLLYVENSVESSLLPFLFEPNNSKTRLRAWSMVDGFMKGVFAGGGVTKYEVVCDDTNNTSQTIDNNELILDLYIAPTRVIEYIRLNVIVTRTNVTFSEIR
jgi:phage tail sheath protein FI